MDRPNRPLRLGTRGSPLALAQARCVAAAIGADEVEIVPVSTTGDRVQDRSLASIGGKALWTKELDRALLDGEVDACVHSMKDVESERPAGIRIAAMLERGDVRDRLIGAASLDALRDGAAVGTCSPRRLAQLKRVRPDLVFTLLRGNVETRLRKVAEGEVEATLLAAAGLDRLGLDVGEAMAVELFLPAPGQAAIGVECRSGDAEIIAVLEEISHRDTFDCVAAERAFTRALGGDCASPVAALGQMAGSTIEFRAQLFSADGAEVAEGHERFERGDLQGPAAFAHDMLERAPRAVRALFGVQ